MAADELVELRLHAPVSARREIGVDQLLDRRKPQLVKTCDRRLREIGVLELGQGWASPERQRSAKLVRGELRVAGLESFAASGEMLLERP